MADSRILFPSQPWISVDNHARNGSLPARAEGRATFAELLEQVQTKQRVSFSGHAIQRLRERNLFFTEQDLNRLDSAVSQLSAKGARESLVYMNDIALVVSVANRKVITAMDGNSAKENIFTNIDSAAIL